MSDTDELTRLRTENTTLRTLNEAMGERIAQYRDAIVPALESNADGWAKRAHTAETLAADLTDQLALNRDTLKRRTDAMHRVAQENDQLRSRLANQETPRD